MTHLIGISGSLRQSSYNTALLRAAFEDLPEGVTAEIVSLRDLPVYDWDVEQEGFPDPVAALRAHVAAADGIVFATPEYNFSVTSALKNAIDWLSRGPSSPLDYKPASIAGAAGGGGTRRSQNHLRDILTHNSVRVLAEPEVLVPGARTRFVDGELTDDSVRAELGLMIDGLLDLIEREGHTGPPHVRGSILLAAADALTAAEMSRNTAERGYRPTITTTVADAERLLGTRSIAAVVIHEGVDEADRAFIAASASEHHPGAPILTTGDSGSIGSMLDDEFRTDAPIGKPPAQRPRI